MKINRLYSFIGCFFMTANMMMACAQPPMYENHRANWLHKIKIAESSTVLLNNQQQVLPLKYLEQQKIASIHIGVDFFTVFDSIAAKYTPLTPLDGEHGTHLHQLTTSFNTVLIQLREESLSPDVIDFIVQQQVNKQLIVVLYGKPTSLSQLEAVSAPILWNPSETAVSAHFMAEAIFGGIATNGRLDQSVSPKYKQGDGFTTNITRLAYTVPEAVGIDGEKLENSIDAIVQDAIWQQATPGAVVLVAKDGKVIFSKAYGYHTFQNNEPVKVSDIFDVASVTKISSTTIAAMRLYEQQKLDLEGRLSNYLPETASTNKRNIVVKDLLLHQSGLVPYMPFHNQLKADDYYCDSTGLYCVKVADQFYLRKGYYEQVMWPKMLNSPLVTPGKYVYSDLSMYMMKEIIERQTKKSLDEYVMNEFYQPLGMQTAGFNPAYRFPKSQIVPTENDTYFRKTFLQGFVHDQGAALAGGVSGHAGLFAGANDLAVLFQMMLNKGSYGGVQYFKSETVDLFTSRQSAISRRGLGFDRWDPDRSKKYPSALASPKTYGHTGFTGTCVWVDPEYRLIYVFLSNRIQYKAENKLSSLKIRPRIQDAVYNAILTAKENNLTKN